MVTVSCAKKEDRRATSMKPDRFGVVRGKEGPHLKNLHHGLQMWGKGEKSNSREGKE